MNTNTITFVKKENGFKAMKAAALIAIMTLFTMSLVGSTFAKYLTTKSIEPTARVAYWGVGFENKTDLFSNTYLGAGDNSTITTVANRGRSNIIAPGTSGVTTFNLTFVNGRAPEVAYKLSAQVSSKYEGNWNGYEPLEFSLDNKNWESLNDFNVTLANSISSRIHPAGNTNVDNISVHWRWPFESGNDTKDTFLGNTATNRNGVPNVKLNVKLTAEQVD